MQEFLRRKGDAKKYSEPPFARPWEEKIPTVEPLLYIEMRPYRRWRKFMGVVEDKK